jgi:hypothetical protein
MFSPSLTSISAHGLVDRIAQLGDDLTGCELGVCRGRNLRFLLDRVPNIKTVYAIDPWEPYDDWWGRMDRDTVESWMREAIELLKDYDDKITVLRAKSSVALNYIDDDTLDYIFIDGDHSYESTKFDLANSFKKIKSKGLFSGHDWQLESVQQAVNEFRKENSITAELQFTENNVWFWYKD